MLPAASFSGFGSAIPHLSVAQNVFLGREPHRLGTPFLDHRKMKLDARKLLPEIGLDCDVEQDADTLKVTHQQVVEIAKLLHFRRGRSDRWVHSIRGTSRAQRVARA